MTPRNLLLPLLAAPFALQADVVKLANGDQITGKVTQVFEEVATVETPYAGTLSISQKDIASITLDQATEFFLTLADAEENASPRTSIVGYGAISAADIRAFWLVGADDPTAPKPPPSPWNYSIAAEARYAEGNIHSKIGTLEAQANYIRPDFATLKLTVGGSYEKTDKSLVTHTVYGSADATYFLAEHCGLYAREMLLTDRPNEIKIRSTFATGGEYFFYKKPSVGDIEMFRVRAGLGHRYEKHRDADETSSSDMTLDFGARFHKRINDVFAWTTEVTYAPAIENFTKNYLVTHDSRCSIDLVKKWKLTQELGIAHTYNSTPAEGTENFDTTCYIRLKKTW